MKWQAISPGRTFEDGSGLVVFFSLASGSTHLLDPVAAFVLDILLEQPRSAGELLQELSGQVEDMPADEMNSLLGKLLDGLQEAELIEAG